MTADLYQAGCSCGWNDSFPSAEAMSKAFAEHQCTGPPVPLQTEGTEP